MRTGPVSITMIPAGNPGPMTGEGNRTYLVTGGSRSVLIDAGTGLVPHLDALSAALGSARSTLDEVLVTHAHADHASGLPAIHARWPQAIVRKFPWPERDAQWGVRIEGLTDGDRIPLGRGELIVVHTPGHSPDHVCLWDPATRTLFGGDLLMAGGTVVVPARRGGRMRDYLISLGRALALEPRRVLPAHGEEITDPPRLIRSYIAHRRRRESQVLDALGDGPADPDALVARIYDRLPDALRPMAEQSVLAHLDMLEEDGRVVRTEGGYALT